MINGSIYKNQSGFTLIELLATLVILSVMFSVAIKKMGTILFTAESQALEAAIGELNVRETLTWTNQKFAPGGFTDDSEIWSVMNTDLGVNYSWTAAPDASGGTLWFGSQSVILNRNSAMPISAARWTPI
jgi:prepilin-type N-terminal cleavage/methylation domain-containing protein